MKQRLTEVSALIDKHIESGGKRDFAEIIKHGLNEEGNKQVQYALSDGKAVLTEQIVYNLVNLLTSTELINLDSVSGVWFGFCSKIPFSKKMPKKKKLRKDKLLVEKVAVTEKVNKVVAAGTVSKVPSYNQCYHVKQVLKRVDLDGAVLSKTDCKFIMEHFEHCKLGQYVDKIDSDRGVNVYVDVKAEHRKSSNAFVVDVNYFRKKPLKGEYSICFCKGF